MSIVQRVVSIVLLTYISYPYSHKHLVLVNSRTIGMMVKSSVSLVLNFVELPIFGQEQCVVNSTICRTIDAVCRTSASLVLLFPGISVHQQKTNQDQCVISPTFCTNIDTLVKISVSIVLQFCRTIDTVVQGSVLLVRSLAGFSMQWSRTVCS